MNAARSAGNPSTTLLTFLLLAGGLGLLAGCGKTEEKVDTVPVSGKIKFGNAPVPMGRVTFYPDASKGNTFNKLPSAHLSTDGTYTLMTPVEGGEKEGAPPGWYRVTVEPVGMSDPSQAKLKMPDLERYSSRDGTPLTVEVKAGAPAGAYDFKLGK
jgi:hypothetical protein